MNFDDMGLHLRVLRAVKRLGYAAATQIQCDAIPLILAGHDVLGCAQTGTGKTAAFALPTLSRLLPDKMPNRRGHHPHQVIGALVLTPTRELAIQVHKSLAAYGRCTDLRHTVIHGGVSQDPQVQALRAGVDTVVATPGRLLDLINQGQVDLRGLKVLVLDEADQMLDLGFIADLKKIVERVPKDRQTLMFSATMPPQIGQLAAQWLDKPKMVHATPEAATPEEIAQTVAFVAPSQKPATLVQLLRSGKGQRSLVFCRTKRGVDSVVRYLKHARIHVLAIHGDKSQSAREKALDRFSSARPPVLVATDVAARGLHIPGVSHVINYDLPEIAETYVHRIGRTARAGAAGTSISLCSADERPCLTRIEKLIGRSVDVQQLQSPDRDHSEVMATPVVTSQPEPAGKPGPSPRKNRNAKARRGAGRHAMGGKNHTRRSRRK